MKSWGIVAGVIVLTTGLIFLNKDIYAVGCGITILFTALKTSANKQ